MAKPTWFDLKQHNRIVVALDVTRKSDVVWLVEGLRSRVKLYKVGLRLFLSEGWEVIELIRQLDGEVFLDLKFHDIPSQVANACRVAVRSGIKMLTVHASGGVEMMREAARAVETASRNLGIEKPALLAVTVLTSLDDSALNNLGVERKTYEQVVHLAALAMQAGLDGAVCSPLELQPIRQALGEDFLLVTPGIRLKPVIQGDQKRTMTPKKAVEAGADFLVVGRPVIEAADPIAVVDNILEQIS